MRKRNPDKQKAKALAKMADKTIERLNKTDIESFPSQTVKDYYDSIHLILEAFASTKGVKTHGSGAHKQLIDWAAKEMKLSEKDREFLHRLRKYRNKINYEGFNIKKSFVSRNKAKIENLIVKLKNNL